VVQGVGRTGVGGVDDELNATTCRCGTVGEQGEGAVSRQQNKASLEQTIVDAREESSTALREARRWRSRGRVWLVNFGWRALEGGNSLGPDRPSDRNEQTNASLQRSGIAVRIVVYLYLDS